MTEAKATFEKVKWAVELIQEGPHKPTVTRVRDMIGGGSRSTILGHMQTLFARIANEGASAEMAEAYLAKVAAGLVKSVWSEAVAIANAEMDRRIKTLIDLNAGIAEGMHELTVENETLRDRAMAAEARVADAENAMKQNRELEDHLSTLSALVYRLQDEPLDPTMFDVMQILSQLPEAPDREELHRRLLAKGHENDRARGARNKAVKDGYVEEKGRRRTLYLTDKGRARLAKAGVEVELGKAAGAV